MLPFNYKPIGPTTWYHRRVSKSNQFCPYCSTFLGDSSVASNKEHLIARRFIPSIVNDGKSFNFIFRACRKCNNKKSEIERHISSVTMFNSPAKFENESILLHADLKAASDFHPDTRTCVKDSFGRCDVRINEVMSVGITMPPQVNINYSKMLAFYHFQGLFALLASSNPLEKNGGMRLLPASQFGYFNSYNHKDWGNVQLLEVVRRVHDWKCVANIDTANGFFKAIIKISPDNDWFWAFEWNKFLRVVGCICNPGEILDIFKGLPFENWSDAIIQENGGIVRFKLEIPLAPHDDTLFSPAVWYDSK